MKEITDTQVNTIIECLCGWGPKEFPIKRASKDINKIKQGKIKIFTENGYEIELNVWSFEPTSVAFLKTPKGNIWKEGAGKGLVLKASQSTELKIKLGSFDTNVEVATIYQVNLNGCKVGRMFDFGPTKKGTTYPTELAINSFYNEDEAKKAAKKFEKYFLEREKERSREKRKK